MKKSLSLVVASVVLAFSLVACANAGSGDNSDAGANQLNTKIMPNVGDVVLKNGKTVAVDNMTDADKANVMAIVYWTDPVAEKYLGMGLEIGTGIYWSKNGATQPLSRFADLVFIGSDTAKKDKLGKYDEILAAHTGDRAKAQPAIDANLFPLWLEYGKAYGEVENPNPNDFSVAENSPALYYAHNYGTNNGVDGEWFLPTALSLCEIGTNRDKINDVLTKLGKTTLSGDYWSSVSLADSPNRNYALNLRISGDNIDSLINDIKNVNIPDGRNDDIYHNKGNKTLSVKIISAIIETVQRMH